MVLFQDLETPWKSVRRNSMHAMSTEWDFADIYREHHRKVFNLCVYLLSSRDAAEDAAHEVFLRAQRKIETYDPALPFSNWILKIASNYCLDVLRRRGTERQLFGIDVSEFPDPSSDQPSPLGEILSSEQGKNVRHALGSLPDKFRIPLVLAYYNEFSYDVIAAALHISRNTVATLLFRGKQQLRRKLKKEKRHDVP
jgi:RNA polymerase sigma-70 factor (ECF subfamily)